MVCRHRSSRKDSADGTIYNESLLANSFFITKSLDKVTIK